MATSLEMQGWAFGNGYEHTVEVGRMLAYLASGGASGVVAAPDLKVTPLDVPGGGVRVMPGAAVIASTYGGGGQQSYAARMPVAGDVDIPATSSAGARTDLIVARVEDPQYAGDLPGVRIERIGSVPVTTSTAAELGLPYPAVALARVTLPASTGTVQAAHITDLRRMASPRRVAGQATVFPTGNAAEGTAYQIPQGGSYAAWPIRSGDRPVVFVPEWATRLSMVVHLSGVLYTGNQASVAGTRVGIGSTWSQNGIKEEDDDGSYSNSGKRVHYTMLGDIALEAPRRGTYQTLNVQAMRTAGSGLWWADYQSAIGIQWAFDEEPI
jgi:hypothetical protein